MSGIYEARTTVYRLVQNVWGGRPLLFDNIAGTPPTARVPWARVSMRHSFGGQETLGDARGKVLFSRKGFVVTQLFVPAGDGQREHDELAELLLGAFETRQGEAISFRNAALQEIGVDGIWFQSNISAMFRYDERK